MKTEVQTTEANAIKEMVRQKYSAVANQSKEENAASCCGATCCTTDPVYNIMAEDNTTQAGYTQDADLGLGCGIPTQFVDMKPGDVVVDLGSGAGNDAFVVRAIIGEKGKVIGIDFSEPMIQKARANALKLNYINVEFRQGDIEHIPMTASVADWVVSNCVLNLVPNKAQAFAEMYRILKPGGQFSISDIVLNVEHLPAKMLQVAELYAGCITGAIPKQSYLDIIRDAGFQMIEVVKQRAIVIPKDILANYLNDAEIEEYIQLDTPIVSITVKGVKALSTPCCTPGAECCTPNDTIHK